MTGPPVKVKPLYQSANLTIAARSLLLLQENGIRVLTGPVGTLPYLGEHPVIMFPSTAGTLRDPSNFGRDWRIVREDLA